MQYVEGESAYSIVAQYHFFQPVQRWEHTNQNVFGRSHVRLHPSLTGNLVQIAALVDVAPSELLRRATIYPLYELTLGQQANKLADQMLYGDAGQVITASKQLAFALPFRHQHQYCPECVKEDLDKHNRFVWRISHQLYGVSWCAKHQLPLQHVVCGDGGVNRRYITPESEMAPCQSGLSSKSIYLSEFIETLFLYLQSATHRSSLESCYQEHLESAGYLTKARSIRTRMLKRDLFNYWKPLFSEVTPTIPLELSRFHDLAITVHAARPMHYLKHVLLMSYLCPSPKAFFEYGKSQAFRAVAVVLPTKEISESKVLTLLDAGLSMRQVSNETGYAVGTVKAIALRNNVSIGRRRKKITKDIERDIWRKAFVGMHRADIAKLHSVSLGAVEQIIQSHKGLSEWRHHLLMCQRKAEHRTLLLKCMQLHPELTRAELKKVSPSYMWLYKNDKDWLYEHLPPAQSSLYHPSLDWTARDNILAIKMRNMIQPAASLSALDRQLGAHGWLLKYADKLPKTMVLAEAKIRQSVNIGSQ
jgi:hypothetical protein